MLLQSYLEKKTLLSFLPGEVSPESRVSELDRGGCVVFWHDSPYLRFVCPCCKERGCASTVRASWEHSSGSLLGSGQSTCIFQQRGRQRPKFIVFNISAHLHIPQYHLFSSPLSSPLLISLSVIWTKNTLQKFIWSLVPASPHEVSSHHPCSFRISHPADT